MDLFGINWNNVETKFKHILLSSLILYEEIEKISILELYKKYLDGEKLNEEEKKLLEAFDILCYYQAIHPAFDNPIAKGELVLDNEEDL